MYFLPALGFSWTSEQASDRTGCSEEAALVAAAVGVTPWMP